MGSARVGGVVRRGKRARWRTVLAHVSCVQLPGAKCLKRLGPNSKSELQAPSSDHWEDCRRKEQMRKETLHKVVLADREEARREPHLCPWCPTIS